MRALNEKDHADILICFYDALVQERGRQGGEEIFYLCERTYGARRGRRMAMKALRDGYPLDYTSYFDYGELLSTPGGYEGSFEYRDGCVYETQHKCPWATAFAADGGMDTARCYCKEIDEDIVRGFNPRLGFESPQNMHEKGECRFYFYGPEIKAGREEGRLAPQEKKKYSMTYHTADVYDVFCRLCEQIMGRAFVAAVNGRIEAMLGEEGMQTLKAWEGFDFERIDNQK